MATRNDDRWVALVDSFHAAALGGQSWDTALQGLAYATGSRSAQLVGVDSSTSVVFNVITNVDPGVPKFIACHRHCVGDVHSELALDVDLEMLFSAVGNLLQNGFKFSQPDTEVSLNAYAAADRIRIDIEDHCGGLPPGAAEAVFLPFKQSGEDRSGLGLGLAICRRSVEANNGVLRVHDVPGSGCVFTIDLPRHTLP
jgi:signal transduction histidine kinase